MVTENMKKNLWDANKILILLVVLLLLNVTPACALQMQIKQEQPKINNSPIITNMRNVNNWFKTLQNITKINFNPFKTQKTINKFKNDKNKIMNESVRDNTSKIKVKVNRYSNDVSDNEFVLKDSMDKANRLYPKLKAQINNANNALKAVDIQYNGIKKEYTSTSATEIELKNDLKDYIATTKELGRYGELQKQCELIHTKALTLHSDLDNLETKRKNLNIQISYLQKGLNDLEQIQSSDQKNSNGNVNTIINDYNSNIITLKNLDNETSSKSYNKSSNNNLIKDNEISSDKQLNNNLNTVDNEPQEPFMDFMLYTSLGLGIPSYFVSIGANGLRFYYMNIALHISNAKKFLVVIDKVKREQAEQLAVDRAIEVAKAKRIAAETAIKERKASIAQMKLEASKSGTALKTETVTATDITDVASSSGTRGVMTDVASSSGTTELISGVAPSSETDTVTNILAAAEPISETSGIEGLVTEEEMVDYLAEAAAEEVVLKTLFHSRVVLAVCISVMVVAAICIVVWLGFKLGWWRTIFG